MLRIGTKRLVVAALFSGVVAGTAHAQSEEQFWVKQLRDQRAAQSAPQVRVIRPSERVTGDRNTQVRVSSNDPKPERRPVQEKAEVFAKPPLPMPETVSFTDKVIVVFTKLQQIVAYENGAVAVRNGNKLWGYASTGMRGSDTRTPVTLLKNGPHVIDPKHRHVQWYSRQFDGAPMPYAQFFNGGVALHQGSIDKSLRARTLGHGLSHGCVRLEMHMAKALFYDFYDASVRVIVVEDPETFESRWIKGYYQPRQSVTM